MIAVYIAKTDDFTVPAVAYDRDSENSMHSLADHIFNLLTDGSNLTREKLKMRENLRKYCWENNWTKINKALAHLDYCVHGLEIH